MRDGKRRPPARKAAATNITGASSLYEERWVVEERQRIADAITVQREWLATLGLDLDEYRNTWSHERVDRLIERRRRAEKGAA